MAISENELKETFKRLLKKSRPTIKTPLLNGATGLNELEIIWSRGDRQKISLLQNQLMSERGNKFR